jgi:glutathione S-transferase
MGDRYTICEPYLFTSAQRLEGNGVDLVRFPQVSDQQQSMLKSAYTI